MTHTQWSKKHTCRSRSRSRSRSRLVLDANVLTEDESAQLADSRGVGGGVLLEVREVALADALNVCVCVCVCVCVLAVAFCLKSEKLPLQML